MTMQFVIEEAALTKAKAKIALIGPSGAGKTFTALTTANELGKSILVIDTENKSSTKYANMFNFHVLGLPDYSLKTYIDALNFAAQQGYDVVIVDSLSHAWAGKGGALEMAEMAKSKYGGNKFAGWADVTPLQNQLVDTILNYPSHLIATMRMKIEYALVDDGRGKSKPQKLGLGVIQRDSFEYEFDVIGQMDVEHNLVVTKTRCFELDGFMANKPGGEFGKTIGDWLDSGEYIPTFTSIEDLLYQIDQDFGLGESEAKQALKDRGFTGWPTDEFTQRQRSREMYAAIKRDIKQIKSGISNANEIMKHLDQTVLDPMLDQEGLTEDEKNEPTAQSDIDEHFGEKDSQPTLVDVAAEQDNHYSEVE